MRTLLADQASWQELGLPKLILAYNFSGALPAAFRGAVARLSKTCPVRETMTSLETMPSLQTMPSLEMLPSLVAPCSPHTTYQRCHTAYWR